MLNVHLWDVTICTETELAVRILSDVASPMISVSWPFLFQIVFFSWFTLLKLQQPSTRKVSNTSLVRCIFSPGPTWDFTRLQSTIKYFCVVDYMTPCIPDTGLCTLTGHSFLSSGSISGVSLCIKTRL